MTYILDWLQGAFVAITLALAAAAIAITLQVILVNLFGFKIKRRNDHE